MEKKPKLSPCCGTLISYPTHDETEKRCVKCKKLITESDLINIKGTGNQGIDKIAEVYE